MGSFKGVINALIRLFGDNNPRKYKSIFVPLSHYHWFIYLQDYIEFVIAIPHWNRPSIYVNLDLYFRSSLLMQIHKL